MTPILDVPPLPLTATPEPPPTVELRGFSYADRRAVLPALTETVTACGCWLLERRVLSLSKLEFRFELQMRAAIELYGSLVAAGLELTRDSHMALTSLCTLRHHDPTPGRLGRVATLRLEVTFMESDSDLAESWSASARA